jgi:hypothetical protein
MKLGFFVLALLAAGSAVAQDGRTRITVEEGKEITVTGCLQRSNDGRSYTLMNAAGKDGASRAYLLAPANDEDDLDDLDKHLGHRLEIKGKAADRGDGRITVRTRSETPKADGGTAKTESRSEIKGDLAGLPYLGVSSFRMIASVCP